MGQKVNPIALRLGIIKSWDSLWYADRDYADRLHQDLKIRRFVSSELAFAGISRVKIERLAKRIRIVIYVAKQGAILGKRGEEVRKVQRFVENLTSIEVAIDIVEVKKVDANAVLLSRSIAGQLEKRVSYKKAMKKALQSAMKSGALGAKVIVSGRLGGAEIARTEGCKEGCVPLHKLRADIGFGLSVAHTTYGTIGVKVWVYTEDRGRIEY